MPCSRCQSSGWIKARTFSAVTPKCFRLTPKMPYCPSSHRQSPVSQFQSHEPMLPAASARLRLSSLCRSCAVDVSSSAVRAETRSSSSAFILSSCRVLRYSSTKILTLARSTSGITGTGT